MERRRLTRDKLMSCATAQASTAATACGSTGTQNACMERRYYPLVENDKFQTLLSCTLRGLEFRNEQVKPNLHKHRLGATRKS